MIFVPPFIDSAAAGADTNIGTTLTQQHVILMRVPNYKNATINGTLTGSALNELKYGAIAFRVSGSLTGTGNISANESGFVTDKGPGHGGWCRKILPRRKNAYSMITKVERV